MSITRRSFLKGASVVGAAGALAGETSKAAGAVADANAESLNAGENVDVTIELNGNKRTLRVLPETSLATAIRDAGLTGTKLSCEGGACGACTVHVDGRPKNGCLALAVEHDGARVTTVEGVGEATALHPVQRAIVAADAVQCGFCTPGFVMSGVAFYESWRAAKRTGRPTRDDVAHALAGNLCRCGCQPALLEAVAAACAGVEAKAPGGVVSGEEHAVMRVDAVDKVTGRAKYTFDIALPHTLHGAFVRSKVPHATIARIDVAAAKAMRGVVDVDLSPIERQGGAYGKLRYIGQPIAVVVAETDALARAAAAAVIVEVHEEAFVIDPAKARADNAVVIWDADGRGDAPNAAEAPKEPESLHVWHGNVRGPLVVGADNDNGKRMVDGAPLKVDLVVDTATQMHATLERHNVVASWDDAGGAGGTLTIYAGSQATGMGAADIADRFELKRGQVRMIAEHVGGGFGSKGAVKPEMLSAARLTMKLKRPVRITLPLDDHLSVGGNRPGTSHRIRIGAAHDGVLQAAHHEGVAYCGVSVGQGATGMTSVHYDWKAHTIVDENVVTNTPPSCPFRAPGYPPNAFALEQAVDEVATQAKKHPLLLRGTGDGNDVRRHIYRYAFEHVGHLGKISESSDGRFVRGAGLATAQWFVPTMPGCKVELRAHRTGHVEASSAIHDMGQGSRTVLMNVVHDELGLAADDIAIKIGDSALVPGSGAFGSLTTGSVSPAALHACNALKQALIKAARAVHPTIEAVISGGKVGRKTLPWRELFAFIVDDPLVVVGTRGDDAHGFGLPPGKLGALGDSPAIPLVLTRDTVASVQAADVTVDRLLGRVRVNRVVTILDCGKVASPITARTNAIGAVMQGVSRALYEERRIDPRSGHLMSRNFETYAILGVADAPDVVVHFLPERATNNPYGALGLGENSTIATCAAVANAFRAATGRRVLTTPMTPKRVLASLGVSA